MSKVKDNQVKFIISEAAKMFVDRTIEDVTMTELAHYLEIGEATLYRYFGKKERIVILAGCEKWNEIRNRYFVDDDSTKNMTGYEKISHFFKVFVKLYKEDQKFLSFINNFDTFVIQKAIQKEDLKDYDSTLISIKKQFDEFYEEGIRDNSIRYGIDKDSYYFASTHAILSLCEKMSRQAIVSSDDMINGLSQIELLINMILNYVRR